MRHLYVIGKSDLTTVKCLEGGRFNKISQEDVESATDVAVSPDGKNLFLAKPESIDIWTRDPQSGSAQFEQTASAKPDLLKEIDIVRVSPKGDTLVAASTTTGSVVLFAREQNGGWRSQSRSTYEIEGAKRLVAAQYDSSGKRIFAVRPDGVMSVLEIR